MLATNTGNSQAGTDKPNLIIYEREAVPGLSISQHHRKNARNLSLTNAHPNNTYENK